MHQYRIIHVWADEYGHKGDMIGYCFADTPEKAVDAFKKHHAIPDEIRLTAERIQ